MLNDNKIDDRSLLCFKVSPPEKELKYFEIFKSGILCELHSDDPGNKISTINLFHV